MKLVGLVAAVCILAAGTATAAGTAQSLRIELQDPSTDPSIEHMQIVLDRRTVKSGRITLRAENRSKSLVHEVLVARDDGSGELPLNANRDRVLEERISSQGEIANLAPGATGTLTLTLAPGAYVLICNLPGHYVDGMTARFAVVPSR